ncbi:MAG TPA: MBL fold metallo-hydrolase [Urbifossiella sp.]|nr:MBL fold metallo-hydrolase [Urbifossiella sp.]
MTARFTVLASGSGGNATLLETEGFGLLIDCGLHPKELTARLAAIGASWDRIQAVVLTHTHSDHWNTRALSTLRSRRISVYAHQAHLEHLDSASTSLASLHRAKLTRVYTDAATIEFTPKLTGRAVWVSHDSEPTFGFRFDGRDGDDGPAWSVGYAADLGCASDELIDAFAGVDVLAIEYNHDEKMERASKRPTFLVQRVLGDRGHLSNRQGADVTRAVAARSGPMFPTHLVQLHLSDDCNVPLLAESIGRNALAELAPAAAVTTAKQESPSRSIALGRHEHSSRRLAARPESPLARLTIAAPRARRHPTLPGFDREAANATAAQLAVS